MLTNRLSRSLVQLAMCLAILNDSVLAAGIGISSPSANQSYAIGAPINYSGTGYWDLGTEADTADVEVELLWFANTTDAYSTGAICDSGEASVVYGKDGNNNFTGAYSFDEGTAPLTATQFSSQTTYYRLYATPEKMHGLYFVSGVPVRTDVELGVIN